MKKRIVLLLCLALTTFALTSCDSSDYKSAMSLYENGQYEEAIEKFTALGDYEDSSDMISACKYAEATDFYNAAEYDSAKAIFEELGNYEDSTQWITACDYGSAINLYNNGDYESAASMFEKLTGYEDSENYLAECNIARADSLAGNGDYSGAEALYLKVYQETGNTKAADGMCACAEAMIASGDTDTASEILDNLTDYEGAETARNELSFVQAEGVLKLGDLNTALTVYQTLPEDFEYDGIAVSDRIALIQSHSDFLAIAGVWETTTSPSASIRQTSSSSGAWDQWDFDLDGTCKLTMVCVINDDDTVTVTGSVEFGYCSNYSSLSSNVNINQTTLAFTYTGTSVPDSFTVNDYVTIKCADGKFVLTYSIVDDSSSMYFDYTSSGTFTYDSKTKDL
jgi:TolA-binding protein